MIILGRLPYQQNEWFVDASSSVGYGGVCGSHYYKVPRELVTAYTHELTGPLNTPLFIAYEELFAVLLAFHQFADLAPNSFVRINSDNSSVVSWVNKARCSRNWGFLYLAAIEFF